MKRASVIVLAVLLIGRLAGYQYLRDAGEAQAAVASGERIYMENCAACHGEKGDGKGPESNRLKTKPRDFTGAFTSFVPRRPVLFLWMRTYLGQFLGVCGLRACWRNFTSRRRRDGL